MAWHRESSSHAHPRPRMPGWQTRARADGVSLNTLALTVMAQGLGSTPTRPRAKRRRLPGHPVGSTSGRSDNTGESLRAATSL